MKESFPRSEVTSSPAAEEVVDARCYGPDAS